MKGAVANPPLTVCTVIVAVPFENVPLAPVDGAVKITDAPTIGLLELSVTLACSAVVNAEPIMALCEAPAVAVMLDAGPGLFVRLKLAGVKPETVAVTEYGPPAMAFAVNVGEAAPVALLATVIVAVPFENVPLAPAAGAAKTTDAPLTGFP